jgi:hypothetical protein
LLGIARPIDVEDRAPDLLEQRFVLRLRYPPGDARRVREAHFAAVDRRMLRLFRVGTLQPVPCCTRIPELAAEERVRSGQMQDWEIRRVAVTLRRPLVGPKVERSGVSDHRQIDRRDWPAKGDVGHVAEGAGDISQWRHVLVEVQQTAESPYRLIPGTLNGRRITDPLGVAVSHRRQGLRLREITAEDCSYFGPDPCDLRVQIGRKDARRIRVIDCWARRLSGLRCRWLSGRHGAANRCQQHCAASDRRCCQPTPPDDLPAASQRLDLPEQLMQMKQH